MHNGIKYQMDAGWWETGFTHLECEMTYRQREKARMVYARMN